MSFSFLNFEQVSIDSGLFSFSGVTMDVVFFGLGGVCDVRMETNLLGDNPISLQALLFNLGMMRLVFRGFSEVRFGIGVLC